MSSSDLNSSNQNKELSRKSRKSHRKRRLVLTTNGKKTRRSVSECMECRLHRHHVDLTVNEHLIDLNSITM